MTWWNVTNRLCCILRKKMYPLCFFILLSFLCKNDKEGIFLSLLYLMCSILTSMFTYGNISLINNALWGKDIVNLIRPLIKKLFIIIYLCKRDLRFNISLTKGTLASLWSTWGIISPHLYIIKKSVISSIPLKLGQIFAPLPNEQPQDGFKEFVHTE